MAAISDTKKAKGLYVSPTLADNVKHIFDFFPFSPEVLKIIFFGQFSIAEQCRSWKIFLSPTPRYWLIPLGTNTIYSDFSARKASDLVSHKILF